MPKKPRPRSSQPDRTKPRGRGRGRKGARSALARALRFAVLLAVAAVGLWLAYEAWRFPDLGALERGAPGKTSFMRYREQEARRAKRPYRIEQHWVPLSRMGTHIREAVVAAEDGRFYAHDGFDTDEIRDALEEHFNEGKKLRGASTISQQLAKNLWLDPSRSLLRKGREALYTYTLERRLSKDRILELYLNVVEWGPGLFGADAAARRYFGVPAERLTREQAALMAAALPNPLRRNPQKPSRLLERRAQRLLRWMAPPPAPAGREPEDVLVPGREEPVSIRPEPQAARPTPATPATVAPSAAPIVAVSVPAKRPVRPPPAVPAAHAVKAGEASGRVRSPAVVAVPEPRATPASRPRPAASPSATPIDLLR